MNCLKYIFIVLFLGIEYSFAIEDPKDIPSDTIELKEIIISANRLNYFTTGAQIQTINPIIKNEYNSSNLSELLSQITSVSIKSYGIAGQSSISLRGLHSKHTAVLWNGINLQNTMNGGFDMNSFPAFLIDGINIQHGGAGALYGSGAVSGAIHLNNIMKLNEGFNFEYQQGLSSFSNIFEGFKVNYSNQRFANSTRAFYKYGKNDFEYVNKQQFGHPTIKQQNAASKQYGILQSNLYKINNTQKISTNILAQKHYLEIPARTTSSSSRQNQDTETLKIATVWNRNGENSSWYSRVFYNYESLIYRDPDISLISEMELFSVVGELENKISIKDNFLFNFGLNHTYEQVMTANYGMDKYRNRTSLFSSFKFFTSNELISTTISFRDELIDNKLKPLTYSIGISSYPFNFLNVHGNLSKTYNNPTFNDLYWQPGGNENLKPENGWSYDLGINLKITKSYHTISSDITYFNNQLKNHIIWLPDSTGNWSALNIEQLKSRGIETSLSYSFNNNRVNTGLVIKYSYTKSTYGNTSDNLSESAGKQLIYIPLHKASTNLYAAYKKYFLKIYFNHVSKRFINKTNTSFIDPYLLADISIGKNIAIRSSNLNINFKVNNLFNAQYEVMAYYAMPQRYYSINITYKLNNSNK